MEELCVVLAHVFLSFGLCLFDRAKADTLTSSLVCYWRFLNLLLTTFPALSFSLIVDVGLLPSDSQSSWLSNLFCLLFAAILRFLTFVRIYWFAVKYVRDGLKVSRLSHVP